MIRGPTRGDTLYLVKSCHRHELILGTECSLLLREEGSAPAKFSRIWPRRGTGRVTQSAPLSLSVGRGFSIPPKVAEELERAVKKSGPSRKFTSNRLVLHHYNAPARSIVEDRVCLGRFGLADFFGTARKSDQERAGGISRSICQLLTHLP